jgi:ribosome-associated protein
VPVVVPVRELAFQFARSGGAGGQNVNKVSTKAVLRWRPAESPSLPQGVRERFLARFAARMTAEGELVLASDRYRDQARNVADCVEKLHAMLAAVERPPKPRRPTRPTRAAKERRLGAKKIHGRKKRERARWDE